jgi:hypothetical protein
MLKNKPNFLLVSLIFFILAFVIELLVYNNFVIKSNDNKTKQESDEVLKEYRICESERINSKLYDLSVSDLPFIDAAFKKGSIYYNGSYGDQILIVISSRFCSSCVTFSINFIKKLLEMHNPINLLIIGQFDNPKGFFSFLRINGIKPELGLFSSELVEMVSKNEEMPIMAKIRNGRIIHACFVDANIPMDYLLYFCNGKTSDK